MANLQAIPGNARRPAALLADFRRYLTVGVGAALVDYSAYALLHYALGLHPVVANAVSRPLGGLFGFAGNRQWTFRGLGRAALPVQFVRFWVVWGLSFTLTEALLWLFHDGWRWEAVASKAGAECVAVLFNFLMQKHWTFR